MGFTPSFALRLLSLSDLIPAHDCDCTRRGDILSRHRLRLPLNCLDTHLGGQRRGIASTAAAAIAFISTVPMLYAARRSLERAFSRLVAVVAEDVLSRRKRKNYVRAVKRRPKPYPLLTNPRLEYRQEEVI